MVIALVCINLKRWRKTLKRKKRIYQADSLFNVFLSCCCWVFLCFESVLIYCCIRSVDWLLLSSLFKSFRSFFSPERNFTCEVAKTGRIVWGEGGKKTSGILLGHLLKEMNSYCPSPKEKVLLTLVPRTRVPLHSTHDPKGTERGQCNSTGPKGSSTSYICKDDKE